MMSENMELLRKTTSGSGDRREDNFDKKALFGKARHPRTALFYKREWAFVKNQSMRENIAYQMQYVEFMIHLYNDYQVYLTIESLLCEDIIVAIGGIVEAALFDGIYQARKKLGQEMLDRTDFTILLGQAHHEYKLISKELWHFFHNLRKVRNNVHLRSADFKEHNAYTVDQVNRAIEKLEEFRKELEV